jgi:hypothetical protein
VEPNHDRHHHLTQHDPWPTTTYRSSLLLQAGPLWRAAVLLAAVKASVTHPSTISPKPSYREAAARVSAYVTEAGLDEVWAASPPFDGEALRGILPGIPHGPPFRHVMDAQVCVGGWVRWWVGGRGCGCVCGWAWGGRVMAFRGVSFMDAGCICIWLGWGG